MKRISCLLLFLVALAPLWAVAPVPYTTSLGFSFRISGVGGGTMTIYTESGVPSVNHGNAINTISDSGGNMAWLRPGNQYRVNFQASGPGHYWLSFTEPNGYTLYVDGVPSNLIAQAPGGGFYSHDYIVELRPSNDPAPAALGEFSGIRLGQAVNWSVGLGGLNTGRTAGRIMFREFDLFNSPVSRERLYYSELPNNGQISLVRDGPSGQTLRQVMVAQGIVDLVDDTNGYWMKFYTWSQASWGGSVWTFSGSPWKTIRVESPGAHQMKITETEGSVSRVSHLSLTSGSNAIVATGGTVTNTAGYKVHTFTSSGTFDVSQAPSGQTMEVLVVAGGGGGGGTGVNGGGGGGGGGIVVHNALAPALGQTSVVVGSGGAGGASGSAGGDSSFGNVVGKGGGGGGTYGATGGNGGSGGGSGRDRGSWTTSSSTQTGSGGGTGYGSAGGASPYGSYGDAGGGGGAGGAGGSGSQTMGPPQAGAGGGNGGAGIASSISGTTAYYGGGGGGASENRDGGTGGLGGGGNGNGYSFTSSAGIANTGGGGGGGQTTWFGYNAPGQPGGSGIVIVRYTTGVGSGNYGWQLQEGDGSTWLRTTTHNSAIVSGGREVTVEVRTGGTTGTVVAKTRHRYENQGWGEELVQTVVDPDSDALTTTYTYHTNSSLLGNYRRVKSVTTPTGGWTAYEYYDDWDRRGQLKYQFEPFLDSPSTAAGASTTTGRVAYFDYAADWTGRHTRPTLREERIGNVVSGKTTWSHSDVSDPSNPRSQASATAYASASTTQTSQAQNFRGDATPDYVGQPYFTKSADLQQTSYSMTPGWFDHGTRQFTINSSGADWREFAFHGSTSSSGATQVSSFGGQSFEPIYLLANKSTLQVTIRNNAGLVLRTETHVYTGGSSFAQVGHEDFYYDTAGRMTSKVASNGATVSYTYTNGRLESVVEADGTRIEYTYDGLGRIATATKKGASALTAEITSGYSYPAQGDITTTYTYNGANQVTQEVVSGGSLLLTTTRQFDLSGRQTQEVVYSGSSNPLTTGIAYASGGRIITTTLPGGATRVVETHYDGQVKSVSGSAVISENYSYWIDSGNGYRARQSTYGGNSSAWTNSAWDWLGRLTDEWAPRWDGNAWGKISHYNSQGQLWKFSQPGLADTLYEYNTLGERVREGLDINGNGTLDASSDDRIQTSSVDFYYNGSSWWLSTVAGTYTTSSSATHKNLGIVYERLTGFGTNVHQETHTYDLYNNVTTTVRVVDRTNKKTVVTTDTPDSNISAVQVAHNGLPVESRDSVGITMRSEYDALGRHSKSIDPRTGTTTTAYIAGTNFISSVTDPASTVQATYTYDTAGRVKSVKNALNKYTYSAYNGRNQKTHEWGDLSQPVEYVYNNLGQQTTLKTYRGGSGWTGSTWPSGTAGTADTTTWNYHAPTNLLSSKVDAGGESVSYTYTVAGQTSTRTWARTGTISTTYGYSSTTGELLTVNYSDSTPDITYTYNRLGQTATVTDYTGTRTLTHNLAGTLELQREDLPGFFGSRRLTFVYDTTGTGTKGRPTEFQLGTSGSPSADQAVTYGYRTDGRLGTIASGGNTFTYGYETGSHLISSVSVGNYTDTRTYDPYHDWVDNRTTVVSSASKAAFAYTQNSIGQVSEVVRTGEIFNRYGNGTQGLKTVYGYTDRLEVNSEVTYLGGTSTVLTGRSDAYAYDNMGNRTSTTHNGNGATYTPDARNRYTQRTVPGIFDVAGAAGSATTVTVNGSPSGVFRHGEYFFKGHPLTNTSNPAYTTLAISDGTTSTNMPAFVAETPEVFGYDADGNLTLDGRWSYQYDAENRMRWMETAADAVTAGHPKVAYQFYYDYLGRRVRKLDFTWNGSDWTAGIDRRFIYHGWNLVAEHYGPYNAGAFPTANVRRHVWGADLSGTMQGAGGVGGLLMTSDSGETYLPAYDAMGNVHAMIKGSDGSVAAAYEYDAFGRTIRESGPYAASNPFRFSTKYTDVETELVYFGLRYYSPTLGRFITRDPIGEQGGLNLYAFVGNNGVNGYDFLGMDPTVQYVAHDAPDPDIIARIHADWERLSETRWLDHGNNRIVVYTGERGEHQYNAYPDEGGFNAYFGFGLMEMDDAAVAAWRASTTASTEAFLASQPVLTSAERANLAKTGGASNASVAPNNAGAGAASGRSGLGNVLRHIPILGGILGGVGDVVSGVGNTALGIVSLGQSGTLKRGVGQITFGALRTVGNAWAMPNTAVGLVYGAVGLPFGAKPVWDSNDAILRFTNMPEWLMPSAMSLGHVQVYGPGSYHNPDGTPALNRFGVPVVREETLHTRQAEVLGPLYLPLHILSMGGSLLTGGGTHDNNPMERGPERGVTPWP